MRRHPLSSSARSYVALVLLLCDFHDPSSDISGRRIVKATLKVNDPFRVVDDLWQFLQSLRTEQQSYLARLPVDLCHEVNPPCFCYFFFFLITCHFIIADNCFICDSVYSLQLSKFVFGALEQRWRNFGFVEQLEWLLNDSGNVCSLHFLQSLPDFFFKFSFKVLLTQPKITGMCLIPPRHQSLLTAQLSGALAVWHLTTGSAQRPYR